MSVFHVPGPCTVKFGPVGNPIDLGTSKAGVTFRSRTGWAPITDDAHGTEAADYIFTGKAVQVEVSGIDVAKLLNANVWHAYGGLFGSGGAAGMAAAIGALASVLGKQLSIFERTPANVWTALIAVPIDPDSLALVSTTEMDVPITFLVVPDANDKLFSVIPSYII